jgi:hypothetical protein
MFLHQGKKPYPASMKSSDTNNSLYQAKIRPGFRDFSLRHKCIPLYLFLNFPYLSEETQNQFCLILCPNFFCTTVLITVPLFGGGGGVVMKEQRKGTY